MAGASRLEAMNRRAAGAWTGVAAAAVAVGVAELVSVATGPGTAPLAAVGAAVIDGAPEPVTGFGIRVFGTSNRVALQVGTLVLLAGAAAVLGVLAVRRRWVGLAGLALFAAVGVAAAVSRHQATALAAAPTLVGGLAAAAVFLRLRPPRMDGPPAERMDGPPAEREPGAPPGPGTERRTFLRYAALALGGGVVAGTLGRWLSTYRAVEVARDAVALPVPTDPAPAVPAGADPPVSGLARYVTANDEFYRIDTAVVVPRVDPREWTLSFTGRVRRPFTLTFDDLLARPMIERYVTLACVSNPVGGTLIGNARWLGVPVAELLAEAGPLPGADQVVSRAVDGWTCGTPTEVLTDGRDALLAIGMNGEPLPPEHGFPVRMVVPGLYGYVSACKWIAEVELTSFDDYDAYWVPRGWSALGPVKTQSRIDVPRQRADAGTVTVAGVAWAQHRGIERVEVRVDDGPWHDATLAATVSSDTWRQWTWRWAATAGSHRLTVRATDSTGRTQPAEVSPVAPDGATGWHTVPVEVG
jgi:DMSO/TMAO reductase YedYZ molybdopterin-dependent catalytic subunit